MSAVSDERVGRWLERAIAGGKRRSILGGIVLSLFGGVVVFITFWVVYGLFWYITHYFLETSHAVRLMVAFGVVLLLFWGNLTTSRSYLESLSFSTGTASDEPVTLYIPGVGMGSTINPLAPDSMGSFVKMITSVLYTGPRIVMASIRSFRHAAKLSRLDRKTTREVLDLLWERNERVSFQEICGAFPSLSPERFFGNLAVIDGILFLSSDPPGISLSTELRKEIAGTE